MAPTMVWRCRLKFQKYLVGARSTRARRVLEVTGMLIPVADRSSLNEHVESLMHICCKLAGRLYCITSVVLFTRNALVHHPSSFRTTGGVVSINITNNWNGKSYPKVTHLTHIFTSSIKNSNNKSSFIKNN